GLSSGRESMDFWKILFSFQYLRIASSISGKFTFGLTGLNIATIVPHSYTFIKMNKEKGGRYCVPRHVGTHSLQEFQCSCSLESCIYLRWSNSFHLSCFDRLYHLLDTFRTCPV